MNERKNKKKERVEVKTFPVKFSLEEVRENITIVTSDLSKTSKKAELSMSELHNFSIKHGLGSQDGIPMPSNDVSGISQIPKLDENQQSTLNIDFYSKPFLETLHRILSINRYHRLIGLTLTRRSQKRIVLNW